MALHPLVASAGRSLREAAADRLTVDPRALVALRVALGALILVDLSLRARWLGFFYTDAGVLPRTLLLDRYPLAGRLSAHALFGEVWWTALLFVAAGVAATCLLVGYRTRVAAVCSLLLLASLHARNPFVLNGGDSLLRRTLLWAVFLPLGSGLGAWARDAASTADDRSGVIHPAAVALVLQPVILYGVNAVVKLRGDAWPSGTAIQMVFSLDSFTVLFGGLLAGSSELLPILGVGWLVLLCCSPALVVTTGRARTAAVGLFATAHLGMALTLGVGLFPAVSVAALLPHLPTEVWDAVERRSRRASAWVTTRAEAGTLALFGGHLPRLWTARRPRLEAGGPLCLGPSSLGSLHDVRTRARASVLSAEDDRSGPMVGSKWVAGRVSVASIGRVGRVAAAALLTVVLVWNAAALGYVDVPDDTDVGVTPESARWDMFAPYPPDEDVRYVAVGTLDTGEEVALIADARESTPTGGLGTGYPSARWRKYLEVVRWNDDTELRRNLVSALCSRSAAIGDADRRTERITLYTVTESTRLGEPEPATWSRVRTHECA
ncbi:HTTM domain-containing protein [Halobaculum marinum]|uniref:HTTM domain-containing protein n=1 Tax=Halobaculum marinum TaxID=3031996 RepID=A0ABD5WTX5_9EURY|nr:HTTM domain-containing protein [Halobaculum sp. DT55]